MALKEMIKRLDPKIWIFLYVLVSAILLYFYPPMQVSHFGINNSTTIATLENQYRTTLAQILGGGVVAISIYFTWNNFLTAQENLKTSQEGQVTERFARSIEQLGAVDKDGNPTIEIRLGAIYALERIANESEKDYWPIMEILTAYVRKNSPHNLVKTQDNVSLDIQAVLTVIGRRKNSLNHGESKHLNLQMAFLQKGELFGAHLEGAYLKGAYLYGAQLEEVHLEGANLEGACLKEANLNRACIEKANLYRAYLVGAYLNWVNFKGSNLSNANLENANLLEANFEVAVLGDARLAGARFISANLGYASLNDANLVKTSFYMSHLVGADLEGANLEGANLEGAYLVGTNFKGAKNLTFEQLSKAKTLYKAQLDEGLEAELRAKGFGYLLDDEPKDEPKLSIP
jgi:uncharacterized protein YjbI with pentapeptide repeats